MGKQRPTSWQPQGVKGKESQHLCGLQSEQRDENLEQATTAMRLPARR